MDVIVIDSVVFKQIVGMFETIQKTVVELAEENKHLKDNRLMTLKEVSEYTGFGSAWVQKHKDYIGYSQIGCKDLRFYKDNIDAYFQKHFIQKKI